MSSAFCLLTSIMSCSALILLSLLSTTFYSCKFRLDFWARSLSFCCMVRVTVTSRSLVSLWFFSTDLIFSSSSYCAIVRCNFQLLKDTISSCWVATLSLNSLTLCSNSSIRLFRVISWFFCAIVKLCSLLILISKSNRSLISSSCFCWIENSFLSASYRFCSSFSFSSFASVYLPEISSSSLAVF